MHISFGTSTISVPSGWGADETRVQPSSVWFTKTLRADPPFSFNQSKSELISSFKRGRPLFSSILRCQRGIEVSEYEFRIVRSDAMLYGLSHASGTNCVCVSIVRLLGTLLLDTRRLNATVLKNPSQYWGRKQKVSNKQEQLKAESGGHGIERPYKVGFYASKPHSSPPLFNRSVPKSGCRSQDPGSRDRDPGSCDPGSDSKPDPHRALTARNFNQFPYSTLQILC